jgi:hypothetical protein
VYHDVWLGDDEQLASGEKKSFNRIPDVQPLEILSHVNL